MWGRGGGGGGGGGCVSDFFAFFGNVKDKNGGFNTANLKHTQSGCKKCWMGSVVGKMNNFNSLGDVILSW